jgi:hypothetical protein
MAHQRQFARRGDTSENGVRPDRKSSAEAQTGAFEP